MVILKVIGASRKRTPMDLILNDEHRVRSHPGPRHQGDDGA